MGLVLFEEILCSLSLTPKVLSEMVLHLLLPCTPEVSPARTGFLIFVSQCMIFPTISVNSSPLTGQRFQILMKNLFSPRATSRIGFLLLGE